MKRRRFLLGVGGLAGASGLVLGSGAFTSVDADRRVTVAVVGDDAAYLALTELGAGGRSIEAGSPAQVELSFPGDVELSSNPNLGVGPDSVYEFDRDAGPKASGSSTDGLVRITNQGTRPVAVADAHETTSELEIALYDVSDPDRTALRDDPVVLGVGEHVDVGVRILTAGSAPGSFDESVTIVAETTEH